MDRVPPLKYLAGKIIAQLHHRFRWYGEDKKIFLSQLKAKNTRPLSNDAFALIWKTTGTALEVFKCFNYCICCANNSITPHCPKCDMHHHEMFSKWCEEHQKCWRPYLTEHCKKCGNHHFDFQQKYCDTCKKCFNLKYPHCKICGDHHYRLFTHCNKCHGTLHASPHCNICESHCGFPNDEEFHEECDKCHGLIITCTLHHVCTNCAKCFSPDNLNDYRGRCYDCSHNYEKTEENWCNICKDYKGQDAPRNDRAYVCSFSDCEICALEHCEVCDHCHGLLEPCSEKAEIKSSQDLD